MNPSRYVSSHDIVSLFSVSLAGCGLCACACCPCPLCSFAGVRPRWCCIVGVVGGRVGSGERWRYTGGTRIGPPSPQAPQQPPQGTGALNEGPIPLRCRVSIYMESQALPAQRHQKVCAALARRSSPRHAISKAFHCADPPLSPKFLHLRWAHDKHLGTRGVHF